MVRFPVRFSESIDSFKITFVDTSTFETYFGEVSVVPATEVYSGSYTVTPSVEAQLLPTAEKFMKYDMTVKAIPFFNVGNTAGGSTVYIGKELE